MGKATNVTFVRCIQRVHANKSPLKIWEKMEHGRIQGLPKFLEYPPIISGMDKAMNFKFGRYIHRVHANKSPLKIGRKWSMSVSRDCPNFLSTPYYPRNG